MDNQNITKLIHVLGNNEMSVKELMVKFNLHHRQSFVKLYLTPAIQLGVVRLLYPNSPKHPKQKYLLTPKGLEQFDKSYNRC